MSAARDSRPAGLVGRPTAVPGVLYRVARAVCAVVGHLLFRIEVSGREHLPRTANRRPAGGWIACGVPHRTWAEPFMLLFILPAQPRIVMLGEGPTMLGSPWRAFLVRRVGGVIPVWRGSGAKGFKAVADAVGQVVRAGGVFAIAPELGPPSRPPSLRRLSPGVARLAQRSAAPVVPVVFGGTHDLYLRRRIVVRILPATPPPSPDADARTLDAWMAGLLAEAQAAAEEAHRAAQANAPRRRWWRWLHGPFPRVG